MSLIALSSNLESYLEVIAELSQEHGHAHVKDVAQSMNVKAPSVTSALQALKKRGFINYQAYSPITLTAAGKKRTEVLGKRQRILNDFFVSCLGMSKIKAETFACRLEHDIDKEVVNRIDLLNNFIKKENIASPKFKKALKAYIDKNAASDLLPLIELTPGDEGIIRAIRGEKSLRKRIIDMGISNNENFKVIRVAPFGDPIEIRIRDYSLSLRKNEAEIIEVEKK